MIEAINLTKKYQQFTAVDNISFKVNAGETLGLVGTSGCGKTTTLKMIAGLEDITRGEIYIDGKLVNDAAPKDRDIAMVFQSYALFPNLTVAKNIAYGLVNRRMGRDAADLSALGTLDL